MERNLEDKTAVITGGAKGIGLEIADSFLKSGAKQVVLLDIDAKEGDKAIATLTSKYGARAIFFKCDVVNDLEAVSKKVFETCKTIDILVNNAGVLKEKSPRTTIDINVTALIEWSLKFHAHMRKDKGGRGGTILNLSSIFGFRIEPHGPIYQASKFAVFGFSKALGHKVNYDKTGVRVIALCPGFTYSDLTKGASTIDDELMGEDLKEYLKRMEWQTPDAVGAAAAEVLARARSGSAWLIEGGHPVSEVLAQSYN